jgi:hypothetical protein
LVGLYKKRVTKKRMKIGKETDTEVAVKNYESRRESAKVMSRKVEITP